MYVEWIVDEKTVKKDPPDYQEQIMILQEHLKHIEIEKLQLSKQSLDLCLSLERIRSDLHNTRSELDQHKARALKTLQEKEKLIAELKSNPKKDTDNVTGMEIGQLRYYSC